MLDELGGHFGRLLTAWLDGLGHERRNARGLRIGVVNAAPQPGSAKHDHEAMLLDRLDKDFDAWNLDLPQTDRQRAALVAIDPPCATIGDVPLGIERAEVGADGYVVGPKFEADAGRFQRRGR